MEEIIIKKIEEEEIHKRVKELADMINEDYKDKNLHLACVLKGGVYFACELSRHLTMPLTIDFLSLSSYGDGLTSQGVITLNHDLTQNIAGKNVLLVEDIIDTGKTLQYVENMLLKREPKTFNVCTLLDKVSRRVTDVEIRYVGFEIEDYFAVGYGLDYAQKYRNLPYIGELQFKEEA
ncbi:MAG: hypoxanthine phosphoribosyltransferase [Eubacterium sp.]|nr:hypoxanthine phosphoribosyltransferase [Eubacterium sp.]